MFPTVVRDIIAPVTRRVDDQPGLGIVPRGDKPPHMAGFRNDSDYWGFLGLGE